MPARNDCTNWENREHLREEVIVKTASTSNGSLNESEFSNQVSN